MVRKFRSLRDFLRKTATDDKEIGLEVASKAELPNYSPSPKGQRFRIGNAPTTVGSHKPSNAQLTLGVLLAGHIGEKKVFNRLLCVAVLIESANTKSKPVGSSLNAFATRISC